MSLSYATVGSNDLERAKAFYDALLGCIGLEAAFEHPSGGRVYKQGGQIAFAVVGPYDGQPATSGNGAMVGFHFGTPKEAAAFHARALELGATDEGAPGVRGGPFFMSYFRDLDGNKVCGFHQAEPV
jgi:catechol 2,3-dioxygenase-like lactoylglutathione lyase family enzyme